MEWQVACQRQAEDYPSKKNLYTQSVHDTSFPGAAEKRHLEVLDPCIVWQLRRVVTGRSEAQPSSHAKYRSTIQDGFSESRWDLFRKICLENRRGSIATYNRKAMEPVS